MQYWRWARVERATAFRRNFKGCRTTSGPAFHWAMTHFIRTGLLLLAAGALRAQPHGPTVPPPDAPVQTARTEIRLEAHNSEAHVQPVLADSSVVVLLGQSPRLSSKINFTFQKYDQELHLRRECPVPVDDEFRFARMCAEGTAVFAVFTSTNVPGRLWVAAFDESSGALRTQRFDTRMSREIVELKALDGRLFATVLLADGQHVTALLLDVATGQMQYLPSVYEPLPTQFSFVADETSRRAEYVLSQTNGRKSRLQVKQLSDRGQLLRSEFVQAESERSLITAQLSPPHDTAARLLTGTYSLRDPNYAQGLFATDLSAGTGPHPPLRFYDFLHLKHFFDYLKPHRQARLRRRVAQRVARAVPPLRWHYRLLLHELLPQPDGGYVLVAEVYYPHYHYSNYGGLGSFGGMRSGYGGPLGLGLPATRVFDGYETTHVLACGFDRQGTLLWDNIFVVQNLRRYELEEAVRVAPLPQGRLALAYLDEEKLRYKIIDHAAPAPDDHHVPLQTAPAGALEKIFETEQADVHSWFGSRLVASGYQHVRGVDGMVREVFFLNAVAF